MIAGLCVLVVFACLVLGSVAFLVCVLVPPTRRFALSTALWFAVWGPCLDGLLVVALLGFAGESLAKSSWTTQWTVAPGVVRAFGWGYLTAGLLVSALVASGVAWVHQKLVHRLTFALFRLYAAVVSAGIGSVFGWCLGWWMMAEEFTRMGTWLWVAAMLLLMAGFGAAAYKGARSLRGKAPTRFTWISADEFEGLN